MPGATRKTVDSAGAELISASDNVLTNNRGQVRVGDEVKGHGIGSHGSPKMAEGSKNVFVNNIAACKAGDAATCGHKATGSTNVFIN